MPMTMPHKNILKYAMLFRRPFLDLVPVHSLSGSRGLLHERPHLERQSEEIDEPLASW